MRKGFTLIELLVVLVVIGVIIGMILPNTLSAIRRANEKDCAANLKSIDTAAQLCYTTTRDWSQCATIAQLTTGNYLSLVPTCPFGTAYTMIGSNANGWSSVKTAHFPTWPPQGVRHIGVIN